MFAMHSWIKRFLGRKLNLAERQPLRQNKSRNGRQIVEHVQDKL
jgi:hypothetical protein